MSFEELPTRVIHGSGVPSELSPEEAVDAKTYARDAHISEASSVAKSRSQSAWQSSVGTIQSKYSNLFTNAGRNPDGTGAWLTIVGTPSAEIIGVLEQLPFDVSLRYGATISYTELRDVANAAVGALQTAGVKKVGFVVNDYTGAITLTFVPNEELRVLDAEQAARIAAVTQAGGALPVSLSFVSDRTYGYQPHYAGGASLWINTNTFDCTTGFNVFDQNTGGNGTVTAAHCGDNDLWGESKQSTVITYVRKFPNAGTTSAGVTKNIDLQYSKSKSGQTASANFQATGEGAADRRTVSSGKNATTGDTVCKWGWGASTGHGSGGAPAYKCGAVTQTDTCENVGSSYNCGLNHINFVTNPGDSGGPVFHGTVAVGYIDGGNSSESLYTQVSRLAYTSLEVLHN